MYIRIVTINVLKVPVVIHHCHQKIGDEAYLKLSCHQQIRDMAVNVLKEFDVISCAVSGF